MPKSKKVLIVEDDDGIRTALRLLVESKDYQCLEASNGKEAYNILKRLNEREEPCIILCDLIMPVMDGFEFIGLLSKGSVLATIPIFITTASSQKEEDIKRLTKNDIRIVKKPFNVDQIARILREYCSD